LPELRKDGRKQGEIKTFLEKGKSWGRPHGERRGERTGEEKEYWN